MVNFFIFFPDIQVLFLVEKLALQRFELKF